MWPLLILLQPAPLLGLRLTFRHLLDVATRSATSSTTKYTRTRSATISHAAIRFRFQNRMILARRLSGIDVNTLS
jgi:hypothetical protein